jgi:ribosome maturation factor RimP
MIKREQIVNIVEDHLEGDRLFLVKASVGKDNLINVYIDGDDGVTIDDCVQLSRYIEQQFDRDKEDFELRVSSSGADEAFVNIRQYKKNIGRLVKIKLKNGEEKKGKLEGADNKRVLIKEQVKSNNKKQKKISTGESIEIPADEILETKVIIII